MNDMAINHLKNLYGLNPDSMPLALQFPRLPPAAFGPISGMLTPKKPFFTRMEKISPKLSDFKEEYQKFASGLLDSQSPLIPPGHPLFSRQNSIETLRAENGKLKMENMELKKQLDGSQNSKHNP